MKNNQLLDVSEKDLTLLRTMLHQYFPQAEVWAYGSRVNGKGHSGSDLDLVVRDPNDLMHSQTNIPDFKIALSESNLPFLVDVVDWAKIPESFHKEIERHYIELIGD